MTPGFLKRSIKSTLGTLGLELIRIPNSFDLRSLSPSGTSGKILELFGPSGIGKSTIFWSQERCLATRWFLPHHASNLKLDSLDYGEEVELIYKRLLFDKVKDLGSHGDNFWGFSGRISYSAKVARRDLLIRLPFPRGFALDEGLCQIFAKQIISLSNEEKELIFRKRVLVSFIAKNDQTVLQRYHERYRERQAAGVFQHPFNAERRLEGISRSQEMVHQLTQTAEEMGAKVVRLFAEDSFEANASRFREVILDGSS